MSRRVVIVGNWKMHMMASEARVFMGELMPLVRGVRSHVYLAPPFTSIRAAIEASQGSTICIGAQNVSAHCEGAYTGEISSAMLKEAGARFVILGHSERRQLFGEDDAIIRRKIEQTISVGLEAILCIGETAQERAGHRVEEVLQTQLETAFRGIQPGHAAHILLAYEPVWAIGSGQTATSQIVQTVHRLCRTFFEKKWGVRVAEGIPILYGGSVKPENISDLMREIDVDGALIGGASLKVDSFAEVIQNVEEIIS